MLEIKPADLTHTMVITLLGRVTYSESHGHFIENKQDLFNYNETAFSIETVSKDIQNPNSLYFIIYYNSFPAGYAKLVLHAKNEHITSAHSCRLERIYILNEFIPLKIGQKVLDKMIVKAKELNFDTIWLTTYIKNYRAINFYKRNNFLETGSYSFKVGSTFYENIVFSKAI